MGSALRQDWVKDKLKSQGKDFTKASLQWGPGSGSGLERGQSALASELGWRFGASIGADSPCGLLRVGSQRTGPGWSWGEGVKSGPGRVGGNEWHGDSKGDRKWCVFVILCGHLRSAV